MANFGSGPATKAGGLRATPRMDSNSRMSKPSTAGNRTAGPIAPNTHTQPSLQATFAKRTMKK